MDEFMKATAIRAIRTVCQTAVATIGTAMALSEVDWKIVLSASALAGILSVLTSVATGLPEVESADEAMDDEYEDAEPYDDEEYDDLYVDEEEEE